VVESPRRSYCRFDRYAWGDDSHGAKMRMTDLRAEWIVVGNDGRQIGTIKNVGQNYVLTSRPGFAADMFIPVSSIANVENEVVHLNITQPDAEQMGWEQQPSDDDVIEASSASDLHRHV
jgi:hypothetical protein